MANKKITAADVANAAGVSRTTVSMILNNYSGTHFSAETKRRVLDACSALGYTIQSRASCSSDKIILGVSPSHTNYQYSRLMNIAQLQAEELGYYLLSYNTHRDIVREAELLRMIDSIPVAGIMFLYSPSSIKMVKELASRLPVILVCEKTMGLGVDTMEIDNFSVGITVTDYMLDLGHKNIAVVMPTLNNRPDRLRRIEGIKASFVQHALDPEEYLRVCFAPSAGSGNQTVPDGFDAGNLIADGLIKSGADITAFIANNDFTAYGILNAIAVNGKRVPQDYSVIGCDNLPMSGYAQINLTTVDPRSVDRLSEAVRILVRKIESRSASGGEELTPSVYRVQFEPKLIKRGSTAKLRNRN